MLTSAVVLLSGTVNILQARLAAGIPMKRSTVALPLMVPAIVPSLAVPFASDFKVRLPPVFNVAPEPTVNTPAEDPPVISSGVPRVADALSLSVRFFNRRLPEVNFTVPAVPPIMRLEVAEPVKLPLPVRAPFRVNVLEPMERLLGIFRLFTVQSLPIKAPLLVTLKLLVLLNDSGDAGPFPSAFSPQFDRFVTSLFALL